MPLDKIRAVGQNTTSDGVACTNYEYLISTGITVPRSLNKRSSEVGSSEVGSSADRESTANEGGAFPNKAADASLDTDSGDNSDGADVLKKGYDSEPAHRKCDAAELDQFGEARRVGRQQTPAVCCIHDPSPSS